MPNSTTITSPIAIGGLGGSGTRVFAALLQHAGYYIGDTLNPPLDNLWFTVLFKRAEWTQRRPKAAEIADSVRLFVCAMTTGLSGELAANDRLMITRLQNDLLPRGSWRCGAQAPHVDALIASNQPPDGAARPWGWKEPNTHVFLRELDQQISKLRYIHIVRDGLDMAFTRNTWQVHHWSHLYDLPRDPSAPMPLCQLRYWVAANRAALAYGARHMPGRFLALRYEDFCVDPASHWARIQHFLDTPSTRPVPADLVQPTTIGRSRKHDLSVFPPELLDEARALYSSIDNCNELETGQ